MAIDAFSRTCLGCACETHPAKTTCLPADFAAAISFLNVSSAGFFTVQLFRSWKVKSIKNII